MKPTFGTKMDLSSEEEIPVFVTQNKFSNSLSVESEYDTDNVISDILGLETLSDTTYMPVCYTGISSSLLKSILVL
jgi:hypothetical protein